MISAIEADSGPIVVSPYVMAEIDNVLLQRSGPDAELQFLAEVLAGAFELAPFGRTDLARAVAARLLTLDERHFGAIRPPHADAFTLLPADA